MVNDVDKYLIEKAHTFEHFGQKEIARLGNHVRSMCRTCLRDADHGCHAAENIKARLDREDEKLLAPVLSVRAWWVAVAVGLTILALTFFVAQSHCQELPTAPSAQQKHERVIDKKFVIVNAVAWGASIADIAETQRAMSRGCVESHTLLYGNRPSVGRMLAVKAPIGVASSLIAYWLKRKYPRETAWLVFPSIITLADTVAASVGHSCGR